MEVDALLTIAIIIITLALLIISTIAADVILASAMLSLILLGILDTKEALAGFSNSGVITIAILYIVAAGLKETGSIQWLSEKVLRLKTNHKSQNTTQSIIRKILLPTAALSAFMNNTAVVSMFIPAIQEHAKKTKKPSSKLLIPLSYIAIIGGTCTLIGTSTNLVVYGLLTEQTEIKLSIFSLALIGIPLTLVGSTFLYFFSDKLLPNRQGTVEQASDLREYSVEMKIDVYGPIAGKSIEEAGLRALDHGYLFEIQREEQTLGAVSPTTKLKPNDRLTFIGAPECAKELRLIPGLSTSSNSDRLNIENRNRCLVEAVIGPEFVGLGESIKESQFRTRFQAAILSVSRSGKRIPSKIGEIKLAVGDTLLLETDQGFVNQYKSRRDFLLVSQMSDSELPSFEKSKTALLLLALMVILSASGILSILESAFLCAGCMLATKCITIGKARRSIDLTVIIVIASSFALGNAMFKTGAATAIANVLVEQVGDNPWMMLAMIYLITVIFTEMITNNAAAILMFPIALSSAEQLGSNPLPFIITIMIAASASFITPIGYQTNLMVVGPGGYQSKDFLKIGIPMSLIIGTTAITLIPIIWPL